MLDTFQMRKFDAMEMSCHPCFGDPGGIRTRDLLDENQIS